MLHGGTTTASVSEKLRSRSGGSQEKRYRSSQRRDPAAAAIVRSDSEPLSLDRDRSAPASRDEY